MADRKMIYLDDAINELRERIRANGYSNVALVSELNRSIGYLMRLPSAQPIDVQEAYYRGKIDGIKECTTRLNKKMNDEVAKGDRDESSERTRPI